VQIKTQSELVEVKDLDKELKQVKGTRDRRLERVAM
jgi:hypothetical protein